MLPVETFVAADRPVDEAFVARLARGGPVQVCADPLMAELGTLGHPARVICIFRIDSTDSQWRPTLSHLHRVIGNVGTVVQAAGALGGRSSRSAWLLGQLSGKGVRA